MKMSVLGGGNIGTLMAAEMACKGHEVTIMTSKTKYWSNIIDVYNVKDEKLLSGKIKTITNDLNIALKDADIIWITYPAFMFEQLASEMEPLIKKGQMIAVIPGGGGVEKIFHKIIQKGIIIFGYQRVHSISRIKEYGKSVYMLGRKEQLQIASIPSDVVNRICDINQQIFEMECVALPNYLTITLTPSNSILHTTRLYSMFKNWEQGVVYEKNYLFYEEWTNEASEWMFKCDDELMKLCSIIPENMSYLKSLKDHYESFTVDEMTNKIRSIQAFKGLKSPMVETEKGWIPDLQSRYFTADFPYGLKTIIDVAQIYGVKVESMQTIWQWYLDLKMQI